MDKKAKITSSKAFCIANLLLNKKSFNLGKDKYQSNKIGIIADIKLKEPYQRLNKLKPILLEAFYYIWQGVK